MNNPSPNNPPSVEPEVVNALTVREPAPVGSALTVNDIIAQVRLIQSVMAQVMKEGEHFGTIPGCGDKKTLFQPGAQKLTMTFRLAPEYTIQETALDGGHKEYRVVCTLRSIQSGSFVGQGVGVCSSMESKYRFRGGARKCPNCGKETIIKGKEQFGGGWLCWTKKGGCGSKWADGEELIENQNIDRVENDNPADTFNTVLKMAKKRAFVDATITATAASDIFTQDIGDPEEAEAEPPQKKPAGKSEPPRSPFEALLSQSKSKFLRELRQSPKLEQAALLHFRKSYNIVSLDELQPLELFPSAGDGRTESIKMNHDAHMAQIRRFMDEDDQLEGAEISGQSAPEPAGAGEDEDSGVVSDLAASPEPPAPDNLPPGCSKLRITVVGTSVKSGTKKNGKPYTRYGLVDTDEIWFNTFSDTLGRKMAACQNGTRAIVYYTTRDYQGKEQNELHGITVV